MYPHSQRFQNTGNAGCNVRLHILHVQDSESNVQIGNIKSVGDRALIKLIKIPRQLNQWSVNCQEGQHQKNREDMDANKVCKNMAIPKVETRYRECMLLAVPSAAHGASLPLSNPISRRKKKCFIKDQSAHKNPGKCIQQSRVLSVQDDAPVAYSDTLAALQNASDKATQKTRSCPC